MTRILKYTKTDILRTKSSLWIFAICLVGVMVAISGRDNSYLFCYLYSLFISIVISEQPYQNERVEDRGFLRMLPSKPGEEILGHFLYSYLSVIVGAVIGFIGIASVRLIHPDAIVLVQAGSHDIRGIYLILLGFAELIAGVSAFLLSIFRYQNVYVLVFFRLFPAFVFFFCINSIMDASIISTDKILKLFTIPSGLLALLICTVLFIVLAVIAGKIDGKK